MTASNSSYNGELYQKLLIPNFASCSKTVLSELLKRLPNNVDWCYRTEMFCFSISPEHRGDVSQLVNQNLWVKTSDSHADSFFRRRTLSRGCLLWWHRQGWLRSSSHSLFANQKLSTRKFLGERYSMNIIHSESEFIPAFEFSGYQLAYEATRWFMRWSIWIRDSDESYPSLSAPTLITANRLARLLFTEVRTSR